MQIPQFNDGMSKERVSQKMLQAALRKKGFNINFFNKLIFFPSRVTVCFTFNKSGQYRTSQKESISLKNIQKKLALVISRRFTIQHAVLFIKI